MKPTGRVLFAVVVLLASAACAGDVDRTDPPLSSDPFEDVPTGDAREIPPGGPPGESRIGPTGGLTFDPTSARLEHGVPYRFSLQHCGLHSPVDVDGSFWDAIDGVTPNGRRIDLESDGEMINSTPGVIVVIGDEARFLTESGSVIRFARHEGDKEFPGCM